MTRFSTDASRGTGIEPIPLDSEAPKEMKLTQLGRYRLCFELASGGMATVYLARMEGPHGFEKIVALKRIHPHLISKRAYVDMFLDEARIASGITHPNVCSVFDFGEADGEYYLAMEYLVGEPLARLCRRAAANPEQRDSPLFHVRMARIIEEACEGLHAAHESRDANRRPLNVVHRDVSPRNLFMTYSGVVQVVDFGIASASQRVHRTSTGQLKGTMPYMAPEQISGGTIDRRLDIWSLGVVLWELLTLDRLFRRGTEAETMYAVLVDDIPLPSERRPGIPPELDAIVMKALQRDPEQRWQTARMMGQALHAFSAKQSGTVGAAELSEWMHELFPRGEAEKREIMELALTQDIQVPTAPALAVMTGSEAPTALGEVPPTDAGVPREPKRVGLTAVTASLLVVLGVAGAWAFQTFEPEELDASKDARTIAEPAAAPAELAPPISAQVPSADEVPPNAEPEADPPKQASAEPTPPVEATEPRGTTAAETEPPEVAPPKPRTRKPVTRRSRPRQKPREASTPKPTTSGLPGHVKIITKGHSVEVYEGAKLLGKTPALVTLPAGTHRLRLKSTETGESMTLPVNVVANATKTISLDVD